MTWVGFCSLCVLDSLCGHLSCVKVQISIHAGVRLHAPAVQVNIQHRAGLHHSFIRQPHTAYPCACNSVGSQKQLNQVLSSCAGGAAAARGVRCAVGGPPKHSGGCGHRQWWPGLQPPGRLGAAGGRRGCGGGQRSPFNHVAALDWHRRRSMHVWPVKAGAACVPLLQLCNIMLMKHVVHVVPLVASIAQLASADLYSDTCHCVDLHNIGVAEKQLTASDSRLSASANGGS